MKINPQDYDVVIAIDVGLTGAVTFFDTVSGEVLSVNPMPTYKWLKNGKTRNHLDIEKLVHILEIPKSHSESAIVVFEDVHAFPGQGSVSTGVLMEQKGVIRGIINTLGYAEYPISPKEWQKWFDMIPPKDLKGKSASQTKTMRKKWLKEKSLTLAREKFPEWVDTKLKLSTAHGVSDSMLIGKWFLETSQLREVF